MDKATWGRGTQYLNDRFAPTAPWRKVTTGADHRLRAYDPTKRFGGRQLRHPFLGVLHYRHPPDRTINFGTDVLRKIDTVITRTLESSAVARFPEKHEDVIITEIWTADELSTAAEFYYGLRKFWLETLPPGRYIGWQPRDLTHRGFFIEIINVALGQQGQADLTEIGGKMTPMLDQTLTFTFKLIREIEGPSITITMEPY